MKTCTLGCCLPADLDCTPTRGVQMDNSADEDIMEDGPTPPPTTAQAQASPPDVSVSV